MPRIFWRFWRKTKGLIALKINLSLNYFLTNYKKFSELKLITLLTVASRSPLAVTVNNVFLPFSTKVKSVNSKSSDNTILSPPS